MQTSEASVPRTSLYTITEIFALVIHLHVVYFDPVPKNIPFGDFLLKSIYYKRLSAAKRQDKAFFDHFLIYSAETVKHTVEKTSLLWPRIVNSPNLIKIRSLTAPENSMSLYKVFSCGLCS